MHRPTAGAATENVRVSRALILNFSAVSVDACFALAFCGRAAACRMQTVDADAAQSASSVVTILQNTELVCRRVVPQNELGVKNACNSVEYKKILLEFLHVLRFLLYLHSPP